MLTLRLWIHYSGYSQKLDSQIEKLIGRRCCGSGFNFITGVRDIDFSYKRESAANTAMKKIENFATTKGIKKFKIKVRVEKNDYGDGE